VTESRVRGEPSTCGAVAAPDGLGDDRAHTPDECVTACPSGGPIRAAWGTDHAGTSSVGYGHHVYAAPGGGISLVAVMDWLSRYGLSWAVSITMDVGGCLEALEHALEVARPEIFTSVQGAHFTSLALTGRRAAAGIQRRMAGRGRALGNVFVARRWRTVTSEEVYWKD
jgi:transposase InsO family protein